MAESGRAEGRRLQPLFDLSCATSRRRPSRRPLRMIGTILEANPYLGASSPAHHSAHQAHQAVRCWRRRQADPRPGVSQKSSASAHRAHALEEANRDIVAIAASPRAPWPIPLRPFRRYAVAGQPIDPPTVVDGRSSSTTRRWPAPKRTGHEPHDPDRCSRGEARSRYG